MNSKPPASSSYSPNTPLSSQKNLLKLDTNFTSHPHTILRIVLSFPHPRLTDWANTKLRTADTDTLIRHHAHATASTAEGNTHTPHINHSPIDPRAQHRIPKLVSTCVADMEWIFPKKKQRSSIDSCQG